MKLKIIFNKQGMASEDKWKRFRNMGARAFVRLMKQTLVIDQAAKFKNLTIDLNDRQGPWVSVTEQQVLNELRNAAAQLKECD
jgi:hypothetical protein